MEGGDIRDVVFNEVKAYRFNVTMKRLQNVWPMRGHMDTSQGMQFTRLGLTGSGSGLNCQRG